MQWPGTAKSPPAGKDGKIRIWTLPAGQVVHSFELNGAEASQVLLSQDGRWLLAGDSKGTVRVWDSATGEVRFETALRHYFDTAAFSPDGNMLAVAATGEPGTDFRFAVEAAALPTCV
ncbi:MAG: hypothetical protein DMG72_02175 [Acidobacteria bacterium]|nr:MAG: hypothetical protein DMG72_02175 [Acidobacteriota bacterium]